MLRPARRLRSSGWQRVGGGHRPAAGPDVGRETLRKPRGATRWFSRKTAFPPGLCPLFPLLSGSWVWGHPILFVREPPVASVTSRGSGSWWVNRLPVLWPSGLPGAPCGHGAAPCTPNSVLSSPCTASGSHLRRIATPGSLRARLGQLVGHRFGACLYPLHCRSAGLW